MILTLIKSFKEQDKGLKLKGGFGNMALHPIFAFGLRKSTNFPTK